MNYDKLRGKIREMYHTESAFAKAIGLSVTTLSMKLNSHRGLTQKDILTISDALNISDEELKEYFFCPKS